MKPLSKEITDYWGSLEAYNEEQRRIGLLNMETAQREGKLINPARARFTRKRRTYPAQYVKPWTLHNGTQIMIRPVRPSDEKAMVKFQENLSERTVYFRWFSPLGVSQRTEHKRLQKMCSPDFDREMALVAEYQDPRSREHSILGIGHLTRISESNDAEISIIIADEYQGQGLGTEIMSRLIKIGRDYKFERIVGDVHPENATMKKVCQKLGFEVHYSTDEEVTKISLPLAA